MNLTPDTVAAYKTLLTNPKENGLSFEPITDCFIEADQITALHLLYEKYIAYLKKPLPKVIFYIVFQEIYGQCTGTDPNGDAGYRLQVRPDLSFDNYQN
jgi:hypothetical protein